jgi:hypothetical protein
MELFSFQGSRNASADCRQGDDRYSRANVGGDPPRLAPSIGLPRDNPMRTSPRVFIPSCQHFKWREDWRATTGTQGKKMILLMARAAGATKITKPIAAGLFVVGMFLAIWVSVATVAMSSAALSPPHMGTDMFSRSPGAATPAAARCS